MSCGLDIILRFIFDTFSQFELRRVSGILTMEVAGQWVPCVRNSSYSLIPILLKLDRCLDRAVCFRCKPQIDICHCFTYSIFRHYFDYENIVLLKFYRCYGQNLKICMWFGFTIFLDYICVTKQSRWWTQIF